ncbi:MAG: hypothetical protein IJ502_04225 [Alistipes sp.]|nr:hypothetical protein [Alistipes sp.]
MRCGARYVMGLWLLVVWPLFVCAQQKPKMTESPTAFSREIVMQPDTLDSVEMERIARTNRMYDSLRVKSERRWMSRLIYKSLFRSDTKVEEEKGEVRDETALVSPYQGFLINDIRILRHNPFEPDGNWLERAANNTHMLTRERIIRRDLLFKVGDVVDPQIIARNKQLLQSRSYISDVDIMVIPNLSKPGTVDILVETRDKWTIDIDGSIGGGEGTLGLSESNLLGRGHKIRVETNLEMPNFGYKGNVIEYEIPNMWGSFYCFTTAVGRRFDCSVLEVGVEKEFLRPVDYEFGVTYAGNKYEHHLQMLDTTVLVRKRDFNIWGGVTHPMQSLASNGYVAARYNRNRFPLRPADTAPRNNPDLHGYDAVLFSAGLYREHFYSSDLIYAYGSREYLASGFKSELTAGYTWEEFDDKYYIGTSQMFGGFIDRFGFLKGGFDLGGFINSRNGYWNRITLNAKVGWFSNLWHHHRTHIRQYVSVGYTQGWNRFAGSGEQIEFTKLQGLNVLDEDVLGTTRLVVNTETIIFTPYEPLGFKTVLFAFADGGFLGFHDNVFRNDAFGSIGLGVRFRNERIVLGTVQIRLGIAFGPAGFAESRYLRLSRETQLPHYRFNPERPEFVTFQ